MSVIGRSGFGLDLPAALVWCALMGYMESYRGNRNRLVCQPGRMLVSTSSRKQRIDVDSVYKRHVSVPGSVMAYYELEVQEATTRACREAAPRRTSIRKIRERNASKCLQVYPVESDPHSTYGRPDVIPILPQHDPVHALQVTPNNAFLILGSTRSITQTKLANGSTSP